MCDVTGVLPRSLQCAKTRSHARKAPCTYTSHAAPKHVPMQKSTLHMQFYRYAMHYKIMVDFALREYFNREQFITEETVDAEITVVMPVQRIHGAEMWIRNKLSNGPLRA